jgi:hypothetical protein
MPSGLAVVALNEVSRDQRIESGSPRMELRLNVPLPVLEQPS